MAAVHDQANYREMCEPFESVKEMNEMLGVFSKDLYELRKKHGIADIFFVVACSAIMEDGDEGEYTMPGHIGDPLKAMPMAAFGYGHEQRTSRDRMVSIAARAAKLTDRQGRGEL